ncbi:MAG TPA: tRNA pseudouridine(38-40) synthase TruA [Tissierellaceae bacterium]|jgi:tRNA pseudouridine38-40 synthase|nr:tRNA pseudouridine(38-40) synthase TruA [Tissierellaceae bacterium]
MRNIKLIIEYDGTNYWGWQTQESFPSIQEEIEKALYRVTGEKTVLYGSGRTDAKVHALGHVANFRTESSIPGERFRFALNIELPEDIRVISSQEVPMDFHARFSATHKRYVYRIYNGEPERPLLRNYTCHIKHPLDVELMREAAKYFIGTHDFRSFRGRRTSIKSSIRTIYSIEIEKKDEIIEIALEGNSFLRNMVRIIAGTLIEVGAGQRCKEEIPEMIQDRDRRSAGRTAPAQGLFLEKVYYR